MAKQRSKLVLSSENARHFREVVFPAGPTRDSGGFPNWSGSGAYWTGKATTSESRRARDRDCRGSTLREDQGLKHVRACLLVRGKELQQVRHGDHAAEALGVVQHHQMIDAVLFH